MSPRFVFAGLVALATTSACAPSPSQDVPSSAVWEGRFTNAATPHRVFVLVLDQASLASNPAFRAATLSSLESWARIEAREARGTEPSQAAWHPVDWSVVVVRPRATGASRFAGPNDDARLALRTREVTEDDALGLARAAFSVAEVDVTQGLFRPIAATNDLLTLVTGARPAEGASESALVTVVASGPSFDLSVALATLHDDEDTSAVEPQRVGDLLPWISLHGVLPSASRICGLTPHSGAPRLSEWLSGPSDSNTTLWPCDASTAGSDPSFSITFLDRLPSSALTASRPILEDENGIPECVAQVRLYQPGAVCDPAQGHRDPPQGRKTIGDDDFGRYQICDIDLFSERDTPGCRPDAVCPNCKSGLCILDDEPPQTVGPYPIPLRFIGEALAGTNSSVVAQCKLEPAR